MSGLENQVGLALPWLVGLRWTALDCHGQPGTFNPAAGFFLYLIEVALAAIILPQTGAWIVTVISILCYGALFLLKDNFQQNFPDREFF